MKYYSLFTNFTLTDQMDRWNRTVEYGVDFKEIVMYDDPSMWARLLNSRESVTFWSYKRRALLCVNIESVCENYDK